MRTLNLQQMEIMSAGLSLDRKGCATAAWHIASGIVGIAGIAAGPVGVLSGVFGVTSFIEGSIEILTTCIYV